MRRDFGHGWPEAIRGHERLAGAVAAEATLAGHALTARDLERDAYQLIGTQGRYRVADGRDLRDAFVPERKGRCERGSACAAERISASTPPRSMPTCTSVTP